MALDAKQLGSAFNTIAYGQVMEAAVRNYVKELEEEEGAAVRAGEGVRALDVDELLDDPELERLHADRIAAVRREAERRAELERKGHGTYEEVPEPGFFEVATAAPRVVCHFYHRDFERCKIVDKHLALLAKRHLGARFIKVSAPDAPFLTVKLGIKVLPAVLLFRDGVAVDRVVGFDALGGKDDFPTAAFEARLKAAGVIGKQARPEGATGGRGGGSDGSSSDDDDDDDSEQQRRRRQRELDGAGGSGAIRRGFAQSAPRGPDDESSDFD